ncbi:MAG: bacterioferritin [Proteobacteria bacterium]|nr:bacterioferritin [Pseudomonadota bacterium]
MGLKPLDTNKACAILNEIMEYELAGVVRYTHSAMMITGPYRIPIVAFLKEQASESLDILEESLEHELHAVGLYKKLLEEVEDRSIYLEEYARGMIGEEEQHSLELKRMLKDYG